MIYYSLFSGFAKTLEGFNHNKKMQLNMIDARMTSIIDSLNKLTSNNTEDIKKCIRDIKLLHNIYGDIYKGGSFCMEDYIILVE